MKGLPDFIIAGAQKSGTTWIVDVLRQHPKVFMPRKEVHFFNQQFDKGPNYYAQTFEQAEPNQLIGEKTPDYFGQDHQERTFENTIRARIKKTLPDVKIILVLRNPIDRAISAFNHYVRMKNIPPFVTIDAYLNKKQYDRDALGIIAYGYYDRYLNEYIDTFGKDKILTIYYEELFKDKEKIVLDVLEFLNLESVPFQLDFHSNKFNKSEVGLYINYYLPFLNKLGWQFDKILPPAKRKPSKRSMEVLKELYAPTILEMERIMGYVPDNWKASTIS